MKTAKVIVRNKAGLHARAASKLTQVSSSYACDIRIGHKKMVDGKSILALMMLAAVKGTELTIEVNGSDEDEALAAIISLIDDRFGESQ